MLKLKANCEIPSRSNITELLFVNLKPKILTNLLFVKTQYVNALPDHNEAFLQEKRLTNGV